MLPKLGVTALEIESLQIDSYIRSGYPARDVFPMTGGSPSLENVWSMGSMRFVLMPFRAMAAIAIRIASAVLATGVAFLWAGAAH